MGHRIVPEMGDNVRDPALLLGVSRSERINGGRSQLFWIEFRTESNLVSDEGVAFDLLHLLSHTDGASFDFVMAMVHDFAEQPVNHPLNPLIFNLLNSSRESRGEPPFRICTRNFVLISPTLPTEEQEEGVRGTWRKVLGRPMPKLYVWNTRGIVSIPRGVL